MSAQRREDDLPVETADQTLDDAPTVGAEDVAQHRSDADAATVENLLHAIANPTPLRDQRAPMAADRPQVAELLGGDEARPPQSELTHPGEPTAVLDIGLATAQLLYLTRVEQLCLDPRVGKRLPRRLPVDAGGLHRRCLNAVGRQPGNQLGQTGRQRAERARLARRLAAVHVAMEATGV